MARIPVRFERVMAAFDTAALGARLCESSGSEHSPESPADLSDLVNSFIERDYYSSSEEVLLDDIDGDLGSIVDQQNESKNYDSVNGGGSDDEGGYGFSNSKKDLLRKLLGNDDDDDVMRKIFDVAKAGSGISGGVGSSGFKRRLMIFLRDKGFDAGLCKSKWEKSKRFPAGDYEYVDVNFQGTRYIVEAFLASEFEIARPTENYSSLLEIFPEIFVGKVGELKQIVRLMCNGIRQSMKSKDMPMPPWRRNCYMQAKWFGSYKRTTKPTPSKSLPKNKPHNRQAIESKRSIGFEFEALPAMPLFCRDGFATKAGLRVSNLTAAFNG